jgi:tetratricopeptide (TPR) repeat protein
MKTYLLPAIICMAVAGPVAAQDATALYDEGVKLKKAGKSAEAIKKFEQAVELKPDYTAATYEMGWCLNDVKKYDAAIVSLRKVRSVWPPTAKVFFELGYAFEKTLQYDSAIASYNQCLEVNPTYRAVNKQLGYIAYTREQNEKALEYFGKYEDIVKDSITDYLYWYRKGFCFNATKNYANALPALEKSMRYKTDYINTYLELGFASSRLKRDDDAIAYYKKAIEIDPKYHVGYNGIGEVYRDYKKDMNEAMNWYKKTLAVVANERKACFGMGYCLNNQSKYSEAIPYLRTAIEKEQTYTAAYVELGYAYYKTGMASDAIINLNKAISLNPANENSRYYLTLLYVDKKDKAKAQQMVDELKKLSSKHVATLQPKVNAL